MVGACLYVCMGEEIILLARMINGCLMVGSSGGEIYWENANLTPSPRIRDI